MCANPTRSLLESPRAAAQPMAKHKNPTLLLVILSLINTEELVLVQPSAH